MPVTTRIILFLVGDPNLNLYLQRLHPGRGDNPMYIVFGKPDNLKNHPVHHNSDTKKWSCWRSMQGSMAGLWIQEAV